jgi:large subunit ribosomal protein L6
MSRVGKKSIIVPDKVTVKIDGSSVLVEGPKGKLSWNLPEGIQASLEGTELSVTRVSDERKYRALHGTSRSLINNMIIGVSQGFVKDLEIVGVGFRAAVKGNILDLNLGKSHPINHPIPQGLTVTVADNTKVKVEGVDKQLVGQFAAEIRSYYPPEPYKGKGVRFAGEVIRRKEGKSVGK